MRYIFISPHLDDVALSCGGIVSYLSSNHHVVEIWTLFAGSPFDNHLSNFALSLHERWNLSLDAPKIRRIEDIKACKQLGAKYKHFQIPDCIYRKDQSNLPIVQQEEDLYQPIPPSQIFLVDQIAGKIESLIAPKDIIISPLGIGNHLDHRITKAAIKKLSINHLLFYEDYPYVIKSQTQDFDIKNFSPIHFDLNEENIRDWHTAINKYQSQISTFWINEDRMKEEIIKYSQLGGGNNLWKIS